MNRIALCNIQESDLPILFAHQKDSISVRMAAFTPEDPTDWRWFCDHWTRILADETIIKRSILFEHQVVGHVSSFDMFDEREVTYWIDRAHWGKGIATQGLMQFLPLEATRPLYARAAKDNLGSRRVLEKCGFVVTDESSGFAHGRGMEVEEFIFTLWDEHNT